MAIAIIGLGYVGLPLARLFATKYKVIGFDINSARVSELQQGTDSTLEIDQATLKAVVVTSQDQLNQKDQGLYCTTDQAHLASATHYIITVPTPVDKNNRPDLTPLVKATETVGRVLKKGNIPHSLASVDKAKRLLDYKPTHVIDQGIEEAVEWYWGNL